MATALETVQQIYAAFGRGDIPALLGCLHEDVQWEHWAQPSSAQSAGVPWLRAGTGKDAVAAFFGIVGTMKINSFQVLGMMASEHQVAVEVAMDATLANGKPLRDEEIHLWNVDANGKVLRMRHYVDTARHIAAAA